MVGYIPTPTRCGARGSARRLHPGDIYSQDHGGLSSASWKNRDHCNTRSVFAHATGADIWLQSPTVYRTCSRKFESRTLQSISGLPNGANARHSGLSWDGDAHSHRTSSTNSTHTRLRGKLQSYTPFAQRLEQSKIEYSAFGDPASLCPRYASCANAECIRVCHDGCTEGRLKPITVTNRTMERKQI